MPPIFIPDDFCEFGLGQEDRLAEYLRATADGSIVQVLNGPDELTLDAMGRTRQGYALAATAYSQICSAVAPGVFQLTSFLAGASMADDEFRDDYSMAEATEIFNTVVQRRFAARLGGNYRAVVHVPTRVLVGLLPGRVRPLDNIVLFEQTRDAVASHRSGGGLHHAVLHGRQLALRFRYAAPLFPASSEAGDEFYGGCYFTNSELEHENSIQGGALLVRKRFGTCALRRLKAVGGGSRKASQFKKRFGRLLQAALDYEFDSGWLWERCNKLRQVRLDIPNDHTREKRIASLASRIARKNLPTGVVRDAINQALHYSGDSAARATGGIGRRAFDPSAWDLYEALARVASACHPEPREGLELAAYKLLTGEFSIKRQEES